MNALSQDLRERIVAAYEAGEGTQQEVADRFGVYIDTVRRLLKLKRETGSLLPRYDYTKPRPQKISEQKRQALIELVNTQPDLTLQQMKDKLALDCSLQAIHYALKKLGYTFKKRHYEPQNKIGRT